MTTILARNADVLVTMDGERRELRNASLFARDGVIEQIGDTADLPQDADVVLDLAGQIVLPGLINCHHHLDQTLTRNLPAGQNTNLFPWLRAHYRIWGSRTPEDSRTATIVGCAELALTGCTTVFDHAYTNYGKLCIPLGGPDPDGYYQCENRKDRQMADLHGRSPMNELTPAFSRHPVFRNLHPKELCIQHGHYQQG